MSSVGVVGTIVDKERKPEVQWKIYPHHLSRTWKENEYLRSPPFHFLRSSWYLRFYPNEHGSIVSIERDNITNQEFPLTLRVRFDIDYKHYVIMGEPHLYTFYKGCQIYEVPWDQIAFDDEHPRILQSKKRVKTNTIIKCFVTEEHPQTMDKSSFCTRQFSYDLKKLYKTPYGWDLIVKVEKNIYLVHKLILQARSPVFNSMFTRRTNKKKGLLNFIGYDRHPVRYFLLFLYTGKVKSCDSYSSAECLYELAYKFQMEDLKIRSRQLIEQKMCEATVCDILELAQLYTDSQLLESAKRFGK